MEVTYMANKMPAQSSNAPGTLAHELHSFVLSPGSLLNQPVMGQRAPRSITMPDGSEWYVKKFTHTIKATILPRIELTLVGIPKRFEEESIAQVADAVSVEKVSQWTEPEPVVEVTAEVAVPHPIEKIDIQLVVQEEEPKPKLERKDAFWRDDETGKG